MKTYVGSFVESCESTFPWGFMNAFFLLNDNNAHISYIFIILIKSERKTILKELEVNTN
jgi:hypothetical protein